MGAKDVKIVSIRRLTADVLAKLLEFDADSQRINFPKDTANRQETEARVRREYQEEPGGMRLVKDGDRVVGCVFLKTRHNPYRRCDYLDLRNIYLEAEYRGKGVGRRLLDLMLAYARQKKCAYLFLGTGWDNADARQLFERFGFRPTRVIMEMDLK